MLLSDLIACTGVARFSPRSSAGATSGGSGCSSDGRGAASALLVASLVVPEVATPRLDLALNSKVCHPAVRSAHHGGYSHVCQKAGTPHVTHECSCGVSWFPLPT